MTTPSAPPEDRDLERLLDGAIGTFGLDVRPEWRRESMAYLRNVADAAYLLMGYDYEDEAEPAPVYRP